MLDALERKEWWKQGEKDRKWYTDHYDELTHTHPKKWICIYNEEIVGVEDTSEKLYKELKKKFNSIPVTYHVGYPKDCCQNCGKSGRELQKWSNGYDSLNAIRMSSHHPYWCRECVLTAQLDHAKTESARLIANIPGLESELAKFHAENS